MRGGGDNFLDVTRVVYHLPKKSGNCRWNVNGKINFVSRTEIFSGKRDFLKGRPKFRNGISEWESTLSFHLLVFTTSGPFGLDNNNGKQPRILGSESFPRVFRKTAIL